MENRHRVVVVGGGFGGLNVVRKLRRAPVEVTLVDRRNFHLFQPLLYQVATGGLSPANIAAPLRDVFRKQENAEVLLGEVVEINAAQREVVLRDEKLTYETLVVATGVRHQYFGHDEWEPFAPGLKTVEDATEIRARVLTAFEEAEQESDPVRVRAWLTFVIVGGGPTGVELAGTICELARDTLRGNFRRIDPASAEVILIEAADRVLPGFDPKLSAKALASLEKLGTVVRVNHRVTNIRAESVTVESGPANAVQSETISAHTVVWAAGVQASPLGKAVAAATGAELDRNGRVKVQPDCSVAGHPEIFVIGDLANLAGARWQAFAGSSTASNSGRGDTLPS